MLLWLVFFSLLNLEGGKSQCKEKSNTLSHEMVPKGTDPFRKLAYSQFMARVNQVTVIAACANLSKSLWKRAQDSCISSTHHRGWRWAVLAILMLTNPCSRPQWPISIFKWFKSSDSFEVSCTTTAEFCSIAPIHHKINEYCYTGC